jgi:hypothetical protein
MAKHIICSKEKEINQINKDIIELKTMMSEVHKALMGNGREGLLEKWYCMEGSIKTWKWIAGSGGLIAIIVLIIQLMKII